MATGKKRRNPEEMFRDKDLYALRMVSRKLYRKINQAIESKKPSYAIILERERVANYIHILEMEESYRNKKKLVKNKAG